MSELNFRSIGSAVTNLTGWNRRKQPSASRPKFRPMVEALEERWCPATQNYWEPGINANTHYLWSEDANWALGHKPTNSEVAVFDDQVGQGVGNYRCEVDISPNPYAVVFQSAWAKQLKIDDSQILECKSYFSAGANGGSPEITMGNIGSTVLIDGNGISGEDSVWDSGYFDGARGRLQLKSVGNYTVTLGIGTSATTNSDVFISSGKAQCSLEGKAGAVVFQNGAILSIAGTLFFEKSAKLIANTADATHNSYILVQSGAKAYVRDFPAVEIDIPILNEGDFYINSGCTLTSDGNQGASDVYSTGTSYLQFLNDGGNLNLGLTGVHYRTGTLKMLLTATKTLGGYSYSQCNGFDQWGGSAVNVYGWDRNTITIAGPFVSDALQPVTYIKFEGGTVNLTDSPSNNLALTVSGYRALTVISATNTVFKFTVSSTELNCSSITVSGPCTVIIDSTDTCYIYGGTSHGNGTGNNEIVLDATGVTGGSLHGDWTWNFANTNDPPPNGTWAELNPQPANKLGCKHS